VQYRRLGGTDLDVSVICLGPMRAAARAPGDDETSRQGELALRAALDAGVNFIHSSYEYGTRWMLRRVLADHPKRGDLHHVIKVPVPDKGDGDRFDPARFRLRVEEALADLAADRIDVLQWICRAGPLSDEHTVPLLGSIGDDVTACFEKLRDEGKVGHLFTFPYAEGFARAAVASGRFAGLIAYYNAAEMEMAALFDDLAATGMGFLCIRPLYAGILTDGRVDQATLPPGDRLVDPKHARDFAVRAKIAETFAEEIGESMTRFAIRFALAAPVVGSVVVGLNTPEQVAGVVAAADAGYPSMDTVRRAQQLWRDGFGLE